MTVLLVDDNEDYLKVMEELLKDHGYSPVVANDGKQAREILEEKTIDVIISDVFMPTLDGVRFHSYVREFLGRDIPFIFMSGYDDPYSRGAVQDSSIDLFISKATPISEVINALEQLRSSTQG